MEWYLEVFKKYAVFDGRARRKEYWMFYLFNSIVYFIFYIIPLTVPGSIGTLFTILLGIYSLGSMIPSLAVLIRRLHDIDKSGWWYFISLIPLIGAIWLLILTCTEGTTGSNSYGDDPKNLSVPGTLQ